MHVNLRNTYEISSILSIIRGFLIEMDNAGTETTNLLLQKEGHFLRGAKPTIYLLRDDNPASWKDILTKELEMLRGSYSSLENKDIAVLFNVCLEQFRIFHRMKAMETLESAVEKWNINCDEKIKLHSVVECISAEWPATISVYRYKAYSGIPLIYLSLSRARVYSTTIIYNYTPKKCEITDRFFETIRQRPDVCKLIDVSLPLNHRAQANESYMQEFDYTMSLFANSLGY